MTLLRRPASPAHPWPGEAQPAETGFVRQNVFYFGASVVVLALAASYQFLTGRLLGPREYAAVAAVFSLFSVLLVPGLIVTLVASRYAAAFAAAGQADQLRFFFRRFSLLVLGISALGALVFLVASPLLAAFLNVPIGTVVSLAPAVFLILPAFFNRGVLQGLQRFVPLSAAQMLDALGRALLAVATIGLGFGVNGAVLAVSVGLALSYGVSLWPLRGLFAAGSARSDDAAQVGRFTVPAAIAVTGMTLLTNVDVLIVKHFVSAETAGIYASVATLGRLVFMVTASITAVMFPRVTAMIRMGQRSDRTLRHSALGMTGVAVLAVIALAVMPSVALLPFGPAFKLAAPYLAVYGTGMGAIALANLVVTYLLARHDMRFIPFLGVAVVLEVLLISLFHASLWQVVFAVTAIGVLVACGIALLYASRPR